MWTAGWGKTRVNWQPGGVRRGTRTTGACTRGVWWVQDTGRYEGSGTL